MNFIKSLYYSTRSAFFRLKNYLIYKNKTLENYVTSKERPSAVVNLDKLLITADSGRYSYILCIYLSYCHFDVIVKTNWDFFEKLKFYQKLLLKQKYLFIKKSLTPINTISLTGSNYKNKIININYGYNSITSKNLDCIAPYPMHPQNNKPFADLEKPADGIKTERTVKIFFSGNVDENLYNKELLKKEFNILSRYEVIQFIKTEFTATSQMQLIEDKFVLDNLMNSDSYTNEIIISKAKTAEQDWFKMLSKASFFICTPGVNAPWCHNSVEAMSVGTIPILQYADLFYPALEDKKNCLVYNDYDELQNVLKRALDMCATEIEIMRNNVFNYFNKYLSVESIAKKIKRFINSDQSKIIVAIPYIKSDEDIDNTNVSFRLKKSLLITEKE